MTKFSFHNMALLQLKQFC